MKRLAQFLLLLCAILPLRMYSQSPANIDIPNPSFENWSTGNGYSVTVLFFPLEVYGSYTYPTGWDYPTYPVNQTITYSGMNVNVNTNVPLLMVTNETSGAVDGSHALKLESFMLSDIISSLVYNLAASSLDTMLTTMVFPTVLTTGTVDINAMLPLLFSINSNLGNFAQMMSCFDNVDINSVIDGGISLGGAVPDRLTGYYKYTSAVSGDNGGVVILGTKYNSMTHKREVVGGGYTIALTDNSTYTPFEVNYAPLSEIDSTVSYVEADSLIIMLISSANSSPQQGTALYLDNLQLWAQTPDIPVDTCSSIFNLTVSSVDTMNASLTWTCEGTPDHFEAEYGLQGFAQGSGTMLNTSVNSLTLSDLQPDSDYDVYVRCVCDSALNGEWSMVSFHTDTLVPPVIVVEDTCSAVFNLHLIEVDTVSATIGWGFEGDPDHFEAEYGIRGFSLGTGTHLAASESFLHLSDLQPDTEYDIYVRCVCDDSLYGAWSMISFHTDTLVPPIIIDDSTGISSYEPTNLQIYPNPAQGRCIAHFDQEIPQIVRLYNVEGVLLKVIIPESDMIELTLPASGVYIITCEMKEGLITRRIVNR